MSLDQRADDVCVPKRTEDRVDSEFLLVGQNKLFFSALCLLSVTTSQLELHVTPWNNERGDVPKI